MEGKLHHEVNKSFSSAGRYFGFKSCLDHSVCVTWGVCKSRSSGISSSETGENNGDSLMRFCNELNEVINFKCLV